MCGGRRLLLVMEVNVVGGIVFLGGRSMSFGWRRRRSPRAMGEGFL